MTIGQHELDVTLGFGTLHTPQQISSSGYKPPSVKSGNVLRVHNRSASAISWLNVDVGFVFDHVEKSSEEIGLNLDHVTTTTHTGVVVVPHPFKGLAAGATAEQLAAFANGNAKSCFIIRVYGRCGTADFIHHHTSGYIEPYKMAVTSRVKQRCFIATAAYGDVDHPMVRELRIVRDEVFNRTALGRRFVAFYYRHSPMVADYVRPRPALRRATRSVLTPVALVSRATRSIWQGARRLKTAMLQK